MSRVFMYSREFPQGKIFDTEPGMPDPLIPTESGWYDSPAFLKMTTDQVVEAAVKQELAKQSPERHELDAEHKAKHGFDPPAVSSDKTVEKGLDIPQFTKRRRK